MQWGINPPSKTPPLLSCQVFPSLNLQTVPAPFLINPISILVFCEPSLNMEFFSEPQKYQFTPLTQSYLLKVTKFLVEISQFEFLIMTEKNIFAHKLFCH